MTAKIIDYKTGKEIKPHEGKCSFCGKAEHQVKHLISNNTQPVKYICGECVQKFTGYKIG